MSIAVVNSVMEHPTLLLIYLAAASGNFMRCTRLESMLLCNTRNNTIETSRYFVNKAYAFSHFGTKY